MPRRDPNARDANPGTSQGEPAEGPAGRGTHKAREAGTAGGALTTPHSGPGVSCARAFGPHGAEHNNLWVRVPDEGSERGG